MIRKSKQPQSAPQEPRSAPKRTSPAQMIGSSDGEEVVGSADEIIQRFALDAPLALRFYDEMEALLERYGDRGMKALDAALVMALMASEDALAASLEGATPHEARRVRKLQQRGYALAGQVLDEESCPSCALLLLTQATISAQLSFCELVQMAEANRREGGDG